MTAVEITKPSRRHSDVRAGKLRARKLSGHAQWWLEQGFTVAECRQMYFAMASLSDARSPDPHEFMEPGISGDA